MKKKYKCESNDCNRTVEYPYLFCSFECACYAGFFNVKTGWKNKEKLEEIKRKKYGQF